VRLTTSLQVGAKYLGCVVCTFHVVYWHHIRRRAKSASNNLRELVLSPTGRLNFGFITERKLTIVLCTPSSWGSQLVRQHKRINKFSGAVTREKEDFCKGSLSLPIFYFVIVLLYFIFLASFYQKYKKISFLYSSYFITFSSSCCSLSMLWRTLQ
jgi:hypothetical protein